MELRGLEFAARILRLALLATLLAAGCRGLTELRVTAPRRVRAGDAALLTCSYNLQGAQLYAVKWYLDDSEFYRYTPNSQSSKYGTFDVRGLGVNVSGSDANDVKLERMQRDQTGRYKCEVSEDHPNFETRSAEAVIQVVEVPEEPPRIDVDRTLLVRNGTLRANCTSGASRPAPNITWTLNKEPLNNRTMEFQVRTATIRRRDGREASQSTLHLQLTPRATATGNGHNYHYYQQQQQHQLQQKLRCFAEIESVYRDSAEMPLMIQDNEPYLASVAGAAAPHNRHTGAGGASRGAFSLLLLVLLAAGLLAR